MFHLIIFFSALLIAVPEEAVSKECSQEEAIRAETEASTLKNWEGVYQSFKRFSHCDDAAISEGYSDIVVRLLSRNWESIVQLKKIVSQDKKFETFVLGHIDELMTPTQEKMIRENALFRCPKQTKLLCKKIVKRVIESAPLE